jgi:ADP-heptose:LPS heptosyltransferase
MLELYTKMKSHHIKRILIYRLGSLGDTVIALPCFHLIADVYPDAKRYVLTNTVSNSKASHTRSILGDSGLVHGYISYSSGLRDLRRLFVLRREIRKLNPDILVYLHASRGRLKAYRDALFFKSCGIVKLAGIPYTEDLQENNWISAGEYYEPEANRLARCIADLGPVNLDHPKSWDLNLTEREAKRAMEVLGVIGKEIPIIACSIGAKVEVKDWGIANWRRLAERLSTRYKGFALVFIGAEVERDLCDQVGCYWEGEKINLCGMLSPRESAAVLGKATLFLGHDSGPMHLAAAMGTPCVSVFSARNKPRVWFPHGNNHHVIYHRTECHGCGLEVCKFEAKKCITSITVEEVEEAVQTSLQNHHSQALS